MKQLLRTLFILTASLCGILSLDESQLQQSKAMAATVSPYDDTELNVPVTDTIRCRTKESAFELGTLFVKYSTSVQWSIPFSKYYELYINEKCQMHLGYHVSKYSITRGNNLASGTGPSVLLVKESDSDGVPTGSFMLIFPEEVLEMVFREDCIPPGSTVHKDPEEIQKKSKPPCWIDF